MEKTLATENISTEQFRDLILQSVPLMDVRAPVEYIGGSIPGSVNLPILGDSERELIGTTYKKKGSEAAVALGYQLVSGDNKEQKIQAWTELIQKNPDLVLYCFRGGQRSQITQQWLREIGFKQRRILGGYKQFRQYLMQEIETFSQQNPFLLISGPTGSGKSHFLRDCSNWAAIADLEDLAHHKGSAFGKEDRPQPAQVDFENSLAVQLIQAQEKISNQGHLFLVEDESRMIGRSVQPTCFFEKLRSSPIIWLEVSLQDRVENIFKDYILETALAKNDEAAANLIFDRYELALSHIQKRLGGLRYSEIANDLKHSKDEYFKSRQLDSHRVWIQKLLEYYYDPQYFHSLETRNPKIFFRGSPADALAKIKSQPK